MIASVLSKWALNFEFQLNGNWCLLSLRQSASVSLVSHSFGHLPSRPLLLGGRALPSLGRKPLPVQCADSSLSLPSHPALPSPQLGSSTPDADQPPPVPFPLSLCPVCSVLEGGHDPGWPKVASISSAELHSQALSLYALVS